MTFFRSVCVDIAALVSDARQYVIESTIHWRTYSELSFIFIFCLFVTCHLYIFKSNSVIVIYLELSSIFVTRYVFRWSDSAPVWQSQKCVRYIRLTYVKGGPSIYNVTIFKRGRGVKNQVKNDDSCKWRRYG